MLRKLFSVLVPALALLAAPPLARAECDWQPGVTSAANYELPIDRFAGTPAFVELKVLNPFNSADTFIVTNATVVAATGVATGCDITSGVHSYESPQPCTMTASVGAGQVFEKLFNVGGATGRQKLMVAVVDVAPGGGGAGPVVYATIVYMTNEAGHTPYYYTETTPVQLRPSWCS